jgi:KipI family sensor histidine kinase inhibitor
MVMGSKKRMFQYFSVPNGTLVYAKEDGIIKIRQALLNQTEYRVYFGLDSFMVFHEDLINQENLDTFLNSLLNITHQENLILPIQEIPIWYLHDSKDWPFIETHLKKSRDEIIKCHTESIHTIEMYGFLPGFAYMKNGTYSFEIPRKTIPETKLPKGTVALAGNYTGIYPVDSPGGWQVIGRCPIKIFTPSADNKVKFEVGTSVQFKAITHEEYKILNEYE